MFSLKEIMKEISKASGLSEDDIKKKVEEKQLELSGLVSPEGAAYIVGKELGVTLLKEVPVKMLKIKNAVPGIRSVDIVGRVVNISEKRDFEKNGRSGSVMNVTLGDETGVMRLSLWNDEIDEFGKLCVKVGDAVKLTGGFVKENSMGNNEMRIGKMGKIEKTDTQVPEVTDVKNDFDTVKARDICDLKEGEYGEIRASFVQVYRRNPFFEICPTCESRLEKDRDAWKCKDHGAVEPKYNLVLSGVMDDGTGNIRVVFFRDLAEKVFDKKTDELRKISTDDDSKLYEDIRLGKEFMIRGRLKRNNFTESLEIVANEVEEVNPKNESEKLIQEIGCIKD